jgi:3-phytase
MRFLTLAFILSAACPVWAETVAVHPVVETDPMPSSDDAADDPCIWVHPTDPELSLIIGTEKQTGLAVYSLQGTQVQFIPAKEPNNVDLRYNFPFNGQRIDIVVANEEIEDALLVYRVDTASRTLVEIGKVMTGIEVYGLCLYHDRVNDTFYAFVNSREGEVEQWRIFENENGAIAGELARSFNVGSGLEGCVADDVLRCVYIGEEEVALWKYNASPDAEPQERTVVDLMKPKGRLTADLEGLTLFYGPYGTGYLIASSQGSDEFMIYRREGQNEYLGTFRIVAGNGIDTVTHTDGIDVSSASFNDQFDKGVFVAQDDENPGANQNFKLVPWEDIANAFDPPLHVEGDQDPRK